MAQPGQDPQAEEQHDLRLRVPAEQRYAELARLAVTGVAARNGCNDAAVDQLDAAFSQAFASLIRDPEDRDSAEVTVTADAIGDTVEFELTRRPDRGAPPTSLRAQR